MKKRLLLAIVASIVVSSVGLTGCFTGDKRTTSQEVPSAGSYLTVKDNTGRTISLPQKPERVVVLSTSFLDLLYAVDGKAVGRPSSKTNAIPKDAQNVPEVGYVYNVNLEKLVALQPEVVIATQGMHEKLVSTMESSHIPILVLKYKTFEDTINTIRIIGDIAGNPEKAAQVTKTLQDSVKEITAKIPQDRKIKVAILHATAKSVAVELETTVAGSIAKQLGVVNIAAGSVSEGTDGDIVPYSLEKLVESDPDILFVVTMGDAAEIEKRMKADVESSPAWSSLRAVQQKKICFLPAELFLLNPGLKLPEAVRYMANIIYPEVYGSAQ